MNVLATRALLDRWSRIALLIAGLGAQTSLWCSSQRMQYLVAPILLAAVTAAKWPRAGRVAGARQAVRVMRPAVCGTLLALCAWDIVAPAVKTGRPPSIALVAGSALIVVHLAHAALARSRRDNAVAVPLVCAMLLLAGLTAHNSFIAIPLVIAMAGVVAGLGWVHRAELLDSVCASGMSVSAMGNAETPRRRPMLARVHVAQVAAIAAALFVVIPNASQHHANADVIGTNASAGRSGALADESNASLDLRSRTPLSSAPVFVASAPAPSYWRGVVYDHYDGGQWSVTGPAVATKASDASQIAQGSVRADSVHLVAPTSDFPVFAPGQVTDYRGPGTIATDADGNLTITAPTGDNASSHLDYQVTSVSPELSSARLASAVGADPADHRWLQEPANLPARVGALAQQVAGAAPTRVAAVDAIDEYLSTHYTYTLDAPIPVAGADAVDHFLFVSRAGYCEQFASAAVVMLRSLGIPARLVTGYAFGDSTSSPGEIVMRNSDAHAWVEVWYPGIGWVDSDPTPSAGDSSASTSRADQLDSAQVAHHWQWPIPRLLRNAANDVAGVLVGVVTDTMPKVRDLPRLWLWQSAFGVILVAMFLLLFWRRGRRRPQSRQAPPDDAHGPLLDSYLRFVTATRGVARRHTETIRESAALVRVPSEASISAALDAVERACYGDGMLPSTTTNAAIQVFDAHLRYGH